jgi:glycosyltransferase involved in cell wall biosynthesis
MNEHPSVTVLMPVYNGENYIAEAISSVLNQAYNDFEFLIVNDGSTDGTAKIISSFKDERIHVLHLDFNKGIAVALNAGLLQATGKYIARFDADDLCFPDRLSIQLGFLAAHEEYLVAGSNAEYINERGEHLFHFNCIAHSDQEIRKNISRHCPFIHSSVMYKKEAVLQAGGYSILAHNFEDYLLWVRLKPFGKFHNIQQPLIKVRFNPQSVTIDERHRGKAFRKLKRSIIERGDITKEEGQILSAIIQRQNVQKIKESSYYSLCGKKYLLNNHQPVKARVSLLKAIKINPVRLENYALFFLSFFPSSFIQILHRDLLPKFNNR